MLHFMFSHETLPTAILKFREWTQFFFRVMAGVYTCSMAACEAFVVLSTCNEILLKTALVVTDCVSRHLAVMLKLNSFLRLVLISALLSKKDLDQRGCTSCSTWLPSQTIRKNSCLEFRRRQRRAVQRLEWTHQTLRVLPALCQHSACACVSVVYVARSVPPALCRNFRLAVSIVTTLWRCIRPVVTSLQELCVAVNMWPV